MNFVRLRQIWANVVLFSILHFTESASNAGKTFVQVFHPQASSSELSATRFFVLSTDWPSPMNITITVDAIPTATYTVLISSTNPVTYQVTVTPNKGVQLTAPQDFVVYGHVYMRTSADGWQGIPVESLGTEYRILGIEPFLATEPTQLSIVAAFPSTTCVTTFPNGTIRNSNLPNVISLDYMTSTKDFSGTAIKCNNKVSVFTGQRCSSVPAGCSSCDITIEQVPPMTTLGRNFSLVPFDHTCSPAIPTCCTNGTFCQKCTEIYRVLAVESNTNVIRYGSVTNESFVLQANQWQYILVPQTELSNLVSDKPILVAQYMQSTSYEGSTTLQDPFLAYIPQVESYLSSIRIATCFSQFTTHRAIIVISKNAGSALLMNGAPFLTTATSSPIPNTNLVAYRYTFNCVGAIQTYLLQHPTATFTVSLYGVGSAVSYGYVGGMSFEIDAYYRCIWPTVNVTSATSNIYTCDVASAPNFTLPNISTDSACCQGNGTLTFVDHITFQSSCRNDTVRTWMFTDSCRRQVNATQQITLLKSAVYQSPPDVTIDCSDSSNLNITGTIAKIGCDSNATITYQDNINNSTYINRTWTVIDQCSNQTLNFNQILFCCTSPTISIVSSNLTFTQCNLTDYSNITQPSIIPSSKLCCNATASLNFTDTVISSNNCGLNLQRTWFLENNCGKLSNATQNAYFAKPFNIYRPPLNLTTNCLKANNLSLVGQPAIDGCNSQFTTNSTDIATSQNIKRAWTVFDQCSNETLSFNQLITCCALPMVTVAQANLNFTQCDMTIIPNITSPSYTTDDNCCQGNSTLTFLDSDQSLTNCKRIIQRIWTVTDSCGFSVNATQSISIEKQQNTYQPPSNLTQTINCNLLSNKDVINTGKPSYEGCNVNFSMTYNDSNDVKEYINRTWTVVDNCSNQTQTFNQTLWCCTSPTINVSSPIVTSTQCNLTDYSNVTQPSIDPGSRPCCNAPSTTTFTDAVITASNCNSNFERTWLIQNSCNESFTATQSFSFAKPFNLYQTPLNVTMNCLKASNLSLAGQPTTDGCNSQFTTNYTDIVTSQNINRAWTVLDLCSNQTVSFNQVITCCMVPTITVIQSNLNFTQCDLTIVPNITSPSYATDDHCCQGNSTLTFLDSDQILTNCKKIFQRIWTVTDACGISANASQIITVEKQLNVYQSPSNLTMTINCNILADKDILNTGKPKYEGCNTDFSTTYNDSTGVSEYINRTWTVVDNCSNQTQTFNQILWCCTSPTINIKSLVNTLTQCDLTDTSNITLPSIDPGVRPCCNETSIMTFTDKETSSTTCNRSISRTWLIQNACGEFANSTQNFDFVKPLNTYQAPLPAMMNCLKANDLSLAGQPTTNGCNSQYTTNYSNITNSNSINRTWTIFDQCANNTINLNQLITCCALPTINISQPSLTFTQCDMTIISNISSPNYTTDDNCCQGNSTLTYADNDLSLTSCKRTILRTWVVTDACGKSTSAIQNITFVKPFNAYKAPPAIRMNCANAGNLTLAGQPTTTGCNSQFTATYNGLANNQYINRTWTVFDQCSNKSVTLNQVITCCTLPTITVAQPTLTVTQCNLTGVLNISQPDTSTDNACCQGPGVLSYNGITTTTSCKREIRRIWTITDACDKTASVNQNITVQQPPNTYQAPADASNINCKNPPLPSSLGTVSIIQACDTTFTKSYSDGIPNINNAPVYMNRRFTVTDDCSSTILVQKLYCLAGTY